MGLEATWAELEMIGRWTGHVLVQCPGCGGRAMVSILNSTGTSRWVKSGGGWPRCKLCCPRRELKDKPRVVPIGDVSRVLRVRPGYGPTARQVKALRSLAAAGFGPEAPVRPAEGRRGDGGGDAAAEGPPAP